MLRSFDFFRKIQTDQDLTSSTGGCFTIVSLIVATLLIIYSLQQFYEDKYYTFLAVKTDKTDYIPFKINMTFSKMPCQENQLKMEHLFGNNQVEQYQRNMSTNAQGDFIKHVQQHFKCRISGVLNLPKTPGSLTFSPSGQQNLITRTQHKYQKQIRMSYRIDTLSFGTGSNIFDFPISHKSKNIQEYIKQLENNVNSRTVVQNFQNSTQNLDYFNHLKIIPVIIQSDNKQHTQKTNYRYSLRTGFIHSFQPLPKITFMTQIQPINIVYKKHQPQFYDLVRKLLAIVGGTVATIGIFNSLSHLFFQTN